MKESSLIDKISQDLRHQILNIAKVSRFDNNKTWNKNKLIVFYRIVLLIRLQIFPLRSMVFKTNLSEIFHYI